MVYLLKMVIFYSKLLVYQRVYHLWTLAHLGVSELEDLPWNF